MSNIFSCPQCKGSLSVEGDAISCSDCDFSGNSHEGIIDLRCGREDYYFNPVPRPIMKELVQETPLDEWPGVIRGFMAAVGDNPDWIDNLVVDGRYAWKVFMSLPENAVCLDIGAGLGNLVHNLSPHVNKCYALDLTLERLQFSKLRYSLFNPNDDVQLIAGGDGEFLPFPDNSLDVVSLSGVLEWIPDNSTLWKTEGSKLSRAVSMAASFFGKSNPRRIQVAFLKEIRRVLKPEGQLFVGIENRLNYEYFVGRNDHHTGLRYGSLLPRFFSNIYSIVVNRTPYRTYTHSRYGYKKLLSQAGFESTKFLGLLNGYSKLCEILPFDFSDRRWKLDKPGPNPIRFRNHVPAYGIITGNASTMSGECFIERMLSEITAELPQLSHAELTLNKFLVTGKDKGVIFATSKESGVIIKLPFSNTSDKNEQVNSEVLRGLAERKNLSFDVPTPLLSGKYQAAPYFVETLSAGVHLSSALEGGNRKNLVGAAFSAWKELLNSNEQSSPVVFDDALFQSFVIDPVQKMRPFVNEPALLDKLITAFDNNLRGTRTRIGMQHGDFGVNNILIVDNKVSSLIDWEVANPCGLPVLDLINLLDSVERSVSGESDVVDTTSALYSGKWTSADDLSTLEQGLLLCDIDPELQRHYVLLYWLHHMSIQLDTNFAYQKRNIDRRITGFLRSLGEIA